MDRNILGQWRFLDEPWEVLDGNETMELQLEPP
jgi:hypothetical protein